MRDGGNEEDGTTVVLSVTFTQRHLLIGDDYLGKR